MRKGKDKEENGVDRERKRKRKENMKEHFAAFVTDKEEITD